MRAVVTHIAAAALLAVGAPTASALQSPLMPAANMPAIDVSRLELTDVPWAVGERFEYDVAYGKIRAGRGVMEVRSIEQVRGRPAYHIFFEVRGGVPFFRVHDVFQSWIDTTTLSSLRFVQDQDEGPKERQRRYEIYPDRRVYTEQVRGEGKEEPSVSNPLDDGSMLYFIRTVPLEVGKTYTFNNYFRPDRNPVTLRVVRRERIRVPAGEFDAIVVQPTIKAGGMFGEDGRAEVWLSDDDQRMMLQMKSKMGIASFSLFLRSHRRGGVDDGSAAR